MELKWLYTYTSSDVSAQSDVAEQELAAPLTYTIQTGNNILIKRVSEMKNLGVMIDERLNFSECIEKIVAKIIGFMQRYVRYVDM